MSHMKNKLVPPLADSDDLEFSITEMKKEVLQMYSKDLQGTKRRRMSILASVSIEGESQLSEAVTKVINFATKLLIRSNGEEAAVQWLQELVRAKHQELKPTETLWSPYTINCWCVWWWRVACVAIH